jgi:hypothetical protein
MADITYPSSDIRAALQISASLKQAATLLGMSQGAMAKRCKRDHALLTHWLRTRERGMSWRKRAGRTGR